MTCAVAWPGRASTHDNEKLKHIKRKLQAMGGKWNIKEANISQALSSIPEEAIIPEKGRAAGRGGREGYVSQKRNGMPFSLASLTPMYIYLWCSLYVYIYREKLLF